MRGSRRAGFDGDPVGRHFSEGLNLCLLYQRGRHAELAKHLAWSSYERKHGNCAAARQIPRLGSGQALPENHLHGWA